MKEPSNILFLLTDDQRHDTIAALGNPWVHTPHMDRLVKEGTAFLHTHVMGGDAPAICMPSRAMIHTGRHLHGLQENGAQIPEEDALLGEWLAQHGYRCFGTGKWHNGTRSFARSFSEGSEIFFGGMADHWNVPACHYDPTGKYARLARESVDYWHGKRERVNHCDHINPGVHSTDLFAEAACRFLESTRDDDRPFYLNVAFMAPHDPRSMPESFWEPYRQLPIDLPPNFLPEHPFDNGELRPRDEWLAPFPRTPDNTLEQLREYFAMITHLDNAIGRILGALEAAGKHEETLVVLAGDNGLAMGQHGLMGKQNLYEHSSRVPLVLAGPGVPVGETREQLCYLHDVMPTLLELCDLEIPGTVQSRSLAPVLRDAQVEHRSHLCMRYRDVQHSVIANHWKLIRYTVGGEVRRQLFHLRDDPWEITNLAGQGFEEEQALVFNLRKSVESAE